MHSKRGVGSVLLGAMAVCGLVGWLFTYLGREAKGATLYRREGHCGGRAELAVGHVVGRTPLLVQRRLRSPRRQRPARADGRFRRHLRVGLRLHRHRSHRVDQPGRPELVPRAVLFWRSEMHFLGGLGIMVLFVAILGLGSAGKTLMRTEMPGPATESPHARTQRAAWVFAAIFIGLTTVLTILLLLQGVSLFDAPLPCVRHHRHGRIQHLQHQRRAFPQRRHRNDHHAVHVLGLR